MLLGGPARLRIDDAVERLVNDELPGDSAQRLGGLHHSNRLGEGQQILGQGARVGLGDKPVRHVGGVADRQRMPDIGGQLGDGVVPQPAVQVVVQRHLRHPPDAFEVRGHASSTRLRSDGPNPSGNSVDSDRGPVAVSTAMSGPPCSHSN